MTKLRLKVICPGRQAGGTNLLLSRCAARLHQRHGYELSLVDFVDGATASAWKAAGVPFRFEPYALGTSVEVCDDEVVLISLLGTKTFPATLKGGHGARLLAWCTAPQDPFKFLPPAYFFNDSSWSTKKAFVRWFFPAQRARIGRFLSEGARHGGVAFMDHHCHEVNEDLFGPGIDSAIVPICTAVPTLGPRLRSVGDGRAYWVGRITDFKTEPFVAMTQALLRSGSPIKEVVVIGDGADLDQAKRRLSGLAVRWLGYVPPENLDVILYEQADLVFGHGTALLEAAKLGIPSLLVDGSYEPIPSVDLRADWLHRCPDGYVGRIVRPGMSIGRQIEACLAEFSADPGRVASADYRRWQDVHHPDAVVDRIAGIIRGGSYTVKDFLATGAARPGWVGSLIEWTKRNVFRRRY